MNLIQYFAKRVKIIDIDNQEFIGKIIDYTSSADNDDQGQYITIKPESGKLEGTHVGIYPNEIQSIEILD